jgi:hypothetical protein
MSQGVRSMSIGLDPKRIGPLCFEYLSNFLKPARDAEIQILTN